MEYIPLISIPVLYFLIAMIKPAIQPKLPFNLCAICAAVSLTWAALLVLRLAGYPVSSATLGILMGMSVTGIMYKSEGLYQKLTIKNFWFARLVIILGGYYGIYTFLRGEWQVFMLIAVISILLIALASLLFQGVTHAQALKEVKSKQSVVQKLDNCC